MKNEPVAWRNLCVGNIGEDSEWIYNEIGQGEPLYTHPADESFDRTASHMAGEYVSYPAKTLTDEEIWKLWQKHLNDEIPVFARAILRKASEK